MLLFPGERSSTGILEWDSKSDAVDALAVVNHTQLENPSQFFHLYGTFWILEILYVIIITSTKSFYQLLSAYAIASAS